LVTGISKIFGALVALFIATIVFAPPIWLLFRRSHHAITWLVALFAVFAVALIMGFLLPEENALKPQLLMAGVIGCVLSGAFTYYLFRLKRQELLR
jgi:uncharacterized membrane protein YccC